MKSLLMFAIVLAAPSLYAGPKALPSILEIQKALPAGVYTTLGRSPCTIVIKYNKLKNGALEVEAIANQATRYGMNELSIEMNSKQDVELQKEQDGGATIYSLQLSKPLVRTEEREVDYYAAIEFTKNGRVLSALTVQEAFVDHENDPSESDIFCNGELKKTD